MNIQIPETRCTRKVDIVLSRRGFVVCFSECGMAEAVVIYLLGNGLSLIYR